MSKDIDKLASSIVDTLSGEFYTHCTVGIGTVVNGIKDLARSFKEAQVALEVGKVFDTEKPIVSYDNLGIARLIYQLPTTLCEMFLKEVFRKGSIDRLDHETLFTIQRFFENNLNVSETSRKLFVHRNTLVYRLEKIKKTHRPGPAGVRGRHRLQGGLDGEEVPLQQPHEVLKKDPFPVRSHFISLQE